MVKNSKGFWFGTQFLFLRKSCKFYRIFFGTEKDEFISSAYPCIPIAYWLLETIDNNTFIFQTLAYQQGNDS